MNPNPLQENLIEKLGLSALPQEEQEEVVEKFSTVLFQAVTLRSLQALDEAQKDRLEKLMEKDPEDIEKMLAFFKVEIPNFNELVNAQIEELMNAASAVKG